jgi:hypothetical protein
MRPFPSPVTITKPDGSSHVTSGQAFRHRDPAAADEPEARTPDGAVTQELLEEMVMRTLVKVMRDSDKLSERTAAATSAVKFLAMKNRLGPTFGEDLDDSS